MADNSVEARPTKCEENREKEGLNSYSGVPKVKSFYENTEFVQYLCLMYRKHLPKVRVSWGEEEAASELGHFDEF